MPKVKFNRAGTLGDLWFAQFDEREVSDEQFALLQKLGWIFGANSAAQSGLSDVGEAFLPANKLPEMTVFFSDSPLNANDLDNAPMRVNVFSRGSLSLNSIMDNLPFMALRQRVNCSETVSVRQFVQLLDDGAAVLSVNGAVAETTFARKMGLNLLNHENAHFVRNTTRLDLERLENGALKIVPLVDDAFVGVATVATKRTMSIQAGLVYTISFEYSGDVDNFNYCYLVSKKHNTFHLGRHAVQAAIDEPRIFSCTFVAPWDTDDLGLLLGFQNTKKQSVTIDKIRFEIGTKRRRAIIFQDAETPINEPLEIGFKLEKGQNELIWLLDGRTSILQIWGDFVDEVRIQAA